MESLKFPFKTRVQPPFAIRKHTKWYGFKHGWVTTFQVASGIEVSDETLERLANRRGVEMFAHLHKLNGFCSMFRFKDGQLVEI